jgi:hypothetical protein
VVLGGVGVCAALFYVGVLDFATRRQDDAAPALFPKDS